MENNKIALEKRVKSNRNLIKDIVTIGVVIPGYLVALGVNRIFQEGKRAYYHINNIPHKFITDDPESSFSYYIRE